MIDLIQNSNNGGNPFYEDYNSGAYFNPYPQLYWAMKSQEMAQNNAMKFLDGS